MGGEWTAEEAFVEKHGVRRAKIGDALQTGLSLGGVGLIEPVDNAGRGGSSALQNRTHARHRADACGRNADDLVRGAERVHAESSVDRSCGALVHRHACPLGREVSPLGRGESKNATKDDESDGDFADSSEHVFRRERCEGIGAALELLIAFLEGGIIDEALALRHFKEAGGQLAEHFIDERFPSDVGGVVIKTQRHRGSFASS